MGFHWRRSPLLSLAITSEKWDHALRKVELQQSGKKQIRQERRQCRSDHPWDHSPSFQNLEQKAQEKECADQVAHGLQKEDVEEVGPDDGNDATPMDSVNGRF